MQVEAMPYDEAETEDECDNPHMPSYTPSCVSRTATHRRKAPRGSGGVSKWSNLSLKLIRAILGRFGLGTTFGALRTLKNIPKEVVLYLPRDLFADALDNIDEVVEEVFRSYVRRKPGNRGELREIAARLIGRWRDTMNARIEGQRHFK